MLDGIPPRFLAMVRLLLVPPAGARGEAPSRAPHPARLTADAVELGRASPDEVLELVSASLRDARPSRRVAALALLPDVEHLPRAAELGPLLRDALRDAPPAARAEAEAWLQRLAPDHPAHPPVPQPQGVQAPGAERTFVARGLEDRDAASGDVRIDGIHPHLPAHNPPPAAQALAALDAIRLALPRHARTAGLVAIGIVVAVRLLFG